MYSNNAIWDREQKIPLKKWKDMNIRTPCIVKIIDDSKVPHLPPKLTEEDVLLHSVVVHRKVICQCVDFVSKDSQLYFSSQRFSIPLGYQGWFEILSEDGKTASPCKTIEEVAEKCPEMFLVRNKVKAYLSESNGDPAFDKHRLVQKGEILTVVGCLTVTHGWRKSKKQILHCLDKDGIDIYLDYKSSGQFSPMAGPTNISGVHNIEGLISQFRLPLTVRIVSGQIPRVTSENDRPGVFRLLEVQKDTTALFLPIKSHQKLLPVSTRTNLQLIPCLNMSEMVTVPFYHQLIMLAQKKAEKYFETMQVLVSAKQSNKTYSASTLPLRVKIAGVVASDKSSNECETEEDVLYAEVDDLYAYVRRGGVPPKPRPRSWANNSLDGAYEINSNSKSSSQPMLSSNGKPRGLLATLTAGKFPTKTNTLQLKTQSTACASAHSSTGSLFVETTELPVTKKDEIVRSYIYHFKGSEESLLTEVDPYVDEKHYQNFETIERVKRAYGLSRKNSLDQLIDAKNECDKLSPHFETATEFGERPTIISYHQAVPTT